MKISKVIFHIKPIPSNPWWECKKCLLNEERGKISLHVIFMMKISQIYVSGPDPFYVATLLQNLTIRKL